MGMAIAMSAEQTNKEIIVFAHCVYCAGAGDAWAIRTLWLFAIIISMFVLFEPTKTRKCLSWNVEWARSRIAYDKFWNGKSLKLHKLHKCQVLIVINSDRRRQHNAERCACTAQRETHERMPRRNRMRFKSNWRRHCWWCCFDGFVRPIFVVHSSQCVRFQVASIGRRCFLFEFFRLFSTQCTHTVVNAAAICCVLAAKLAKFIHLIIVSSFHEKKNK